LLVLSAILLLSSAAAFETEQIQVVSPHAPQNSPLSLADPDEDVESSAPFGVRMALAVARFAAMARDGQRP